MKKESTITTPKNGKLKIARLVVTEKQYNIEGKAINNRLQSVIRKFLKKEYGKRIYEFILTPGGFLIFDFPERIDYKEDVTKPKQESIELLQETAADKINSFFESLDSDLLEQLQDTADYFSIGIDGRSLINNQHIEFVAIYDLKKGEIAHWTGKFYPTKNQQSSLIRFNDLDTHFIELNNQRVMLLGCHDLTVYSSRGQAASDPNKWRYKLSNKFRKAAKKFKPEIVLQHPHSTDTPATWKASWNQLVKELPSVKHYASGIKYENIDGEELREDIEVVLERTREGDVTDFYFD